jgi:hypothetical protein
MILSATLKRESADGETVHYVDSYGGKHAFLSEAIVIRASDLPDPPPALLRVSLSWYQAPRAQDDGSGTGEESILAAGAGRQGIAQGDRVEVIKSRVSGVKNPPEWLEQYVGRIGIVLWTTTDGAMVDLKTDTAWFSYEELQYKD